MTTSEGRKTRTQPKGKNMLAKPKTENRVSSAAKPIGSGNGHSAAEATRLGRRSFLRRLGWGGTALIPIGGLLTTANSARADHGDDGNQGHNGRDNRGNQRLTKGDAAILRFLAAAEILETDLWQQCNELALGNPAFQAGLM